jgi:hypothetical protein
VSINRRISRGNSWSNVNENENDVLQYSDNKENIDNNEEEV